MVDSFTCLHQLVRLEFARSCNAIALSHLASIFIQPRQMSLFSIMLNSTPLQRNRAALDFTQSLTLFQVRQLRAMIPQNLICLLILLFTLDIALFQATTLYDASILFFQTIKYPSIPILTSLNPGGCGGIVYNRLFTLSNFSNPLVFSAPTYTSSPSTGFKIG